MKKRIYLFLILFFGLFYGYSVKAAASLSVSSSNVTVGDSFTATVYVSSAASWDIHVSASGPVGGCVINEANASDSGMNISTSFSTTCTTTGTGTITVTLNGNTTGEADDFATEVYGTQSVSVSEPAPPPEPDPVPSPSPSTKPSLSPSDGDATKSSNTTIKELTAKGVIFTKEGDTFKAIVPSSISEIDLKITLEDSKSKVKGNGKHSLDIGDNHFTIVVTAEDGTEKKYEVYITREGEISFDSLESVIKESSGQNISVSIPLKTIIKKDVFQLIQEKDKVVTLNYYQDSKKLYSWIIHGDELNHYQDFSTDVLMDSPRRKKIAMLSDYSFGKMIQIEHKILIPEGITFSLYVGDDFNDGDTVSIYRYVDSKDDLTLVDERLVVKDGYVTFRATRGGDYFIAKYKEKAFSIWILVPIGGILILGFIFYSYFKKKKKDKKEKKEQEKDSEDKKITKGAKFIFN